MTLVRGDKAPEVLQQGLMCVAKGIVWMILTLYALLRVLVVTKSTHCKIASVCKYKMHPSVHSGLTVQPTG